MMLTLDLSPWVLLILVIGACYLDFRFNGRR